MAPRALESRDEFLKRLQAAAKDGHTQVRFGQHHFSHAVLLEGGTWRVRRLTLSREKADAYFKKHDMFMPEHAEMLSEPGDDVAFEAPTLDALVAAFRARPWPL